MPKIDFQIGISLLDARANASLANELNHLRQGTGSRRGCLHNIQSVFEGKALLSWFSDKDLTLMRRHAYSCAMLERERYQFAPDGWVGAFGLLMPLMSNHPELIHWHSQYVAPVWSDKPKRNARNRVNAPEYHAFQAHLALQGKFDLLGERAEYILANPPSSKSMHKYQEDHRFYLALAKGDMTEMEQVLYELTGPRAKVRNFDQALTLTAHLLSCWGFIYAKLAWLNGFEVQVDTPYMPMEWMPMTPLTEYQTQYSQEYNEPFDFIDSVEIFEPFADKLAYLSPVPIGQTPFDITQGSQPEPSK